MDIFTTVVGCCTIIGSAAAVVSLILYILDKKEK